MHVLPTPIPVYLAACKTYDLPTTERVVAELLRNIGFCPVTGTKVLLKPNLLRADPTGLSCTHPAIVRAACLYLLDCGCRITIGDSPGFGTGAGVASKLGITQAIRNIPGGKDIPIITLNEPIPLPLSIGGTVPVSRHALESDIILSLPKLKAHSQMGITLAVKNSFGCVCGVHKAVLHAKHGDKGTQFSAMLADVAAHLPQTVALLDGVIAMSRTGPTGGDAYPAGLLAASCSCVALDTAICTLLGLSPNTIPLWQELQRRDAPGAKPEAISLQGDPPNSFDLHGFTTPARLRPQSFQLHVLLKSFCKRLWAKIRN